jgi:hypothetical protein
VCSSDLLGVLAERVRRADRPRVNPCVSLEEDLQQIWSAASHLYHDAADIIYRTDVGKELEVEVSELLNLLRDCGIG